jgi:hypothetical protein
MRLIARVEADRIGIGVNVTGVLVSSAGTRVVEDI